MIMRMLRRIIGISSAIMSLLVVLVFMAGTSYAATVGLTAGVTTKTMPDTGEVITVWGFCLTGTPLCPGTPGPATSAITVPGPRVTVPVGESLTINLTNTLTVPVSLVIPGQQADSMTPTIVGGRVMSFTAEAAANGGSHTYTWTTLRPGTYLYESGTNPAVQVPMGLYGALTQDAAANTAYAGGPTYDQEVLLLFSEIDPKLNHAVAKGRYGDVRKTLMTSTIGFKARYYLINGQPYSAATTPVPAGIVGNNVLIRFLNAGNEPRVPVLQSGTYLDIISEDGNKLTYSKNQYSLLLTAGKTMDALWVPAESGNVPLYDRELGMTNDKTGPGGMLAYLHVDAAPTANSAILMVTLAGTGSGTVTGTGISCGADCTEAFDPAAASVVALTQTPDVGSVFSGWSGACTGIAACNVTMDASKSVTATYTRQYTLTVAKTGIGAGSVVSKPAGISCGNGCKGPVNATFSSGTVVKLTATPRADSVFAGWVEGCSTAQTCVKTMDKDSTVTVNFVGKYSVAGKVTTSAGVPIAGTTITVTKGVDVVGTATTDSTGKYKVKNLSNGTYTITPSGTGAPFTPVSRHATINGAGVGGKNFTGTP